MEARTEECESFTPACLYCCWHKCPAQGTGERKGQSLAVCPETRFQPTENFQLPNSRYVFSWEIFLNPSVLKLRKPCVCFRSLLQFRVSHTGLWDGSLLPSKVHFSSIPPFTCLLLQEPQLGPPHPVILHLTPRKINEITSSWLGRSCLLALPHPTPRHSAITYLFGMCLPHVSLACFSQMLQPSTPPLSQETQSHVTWSVRWRPCSFANPFSSLPFPCPSYPLPSSLTDLTITAVTPYPRRTGFRIPPRHQNLQMPNHLHNEDGGTCLWFRHWESEAEGSRV